MESKKDSDFVAKVLIFDKEKGVLILKRASDVGFAPRKWDLPGGHVHEGEKQEHGAKREVKEETNLEIGALHEYSFIGKMTFFVTTKYSGKIIVDKTENSEHNWVKLDNIDKFDFGPDMGVVIKKFLNEKEKILQEIEPYQRKVKKKHRRMKVRLIGKGKNRHNVGRKMKKPRYRRSKSAPPGAGGA